MEPKDDQKFINVLLLGETGVGKSTAINSIANYLAYSNFKIAEKSKLVVPVPSKFTVRDKYNEEHTVEVGERDDDENLDPGTASQGPKSYVFPIQEGRLILRLIDTPGIGDVRGIDQDNVNFENILGYIEELQELHAICCLFQPCSSTRRSVFFDYCMTQILSRLDKSASDNIIFMFTNTRGTAYGPGETLPNIQKILDDIRAESPDIKIPLNKNVFCFDNEAFRYLAAIQKNVKLDLFTRRNSYHSWKRSSEAYIQMINYIIGDERNPPLKPHFVQSTKAVNEARRAIMALSQPLAEISSLIAANSQILERYKNHLEMNSKTIDELKKQLYIPIFDLEVVRLSAPVTVCTSKKCAEVYKVGELHKWNYKQHCHDPCYVKNVKNLKEIIGDPELLNCSCGPLKWKNGVCVECQCDFSTHMHVYDETRAVEAKIIDKNVEKELDNKHKIQDEVNQVIANINNKIMDWQEENNTNCRTCVGFARFLKKNAIKPFADSIRQYIEYTIKCEEATDADGAILNRLRTLLREYDAAKKVFDDASP